MEEDLFGNKVIREEFFEITYKGDSFIGGSMLISSLYLELQGLEHLLQDSINLLIENHKLDPSSRDFQIFIQIGRGSIFEKIKVLFKHKTTIAIIGTFIIPFLNTTYNHFLNGRQTNEGNQFYQEIKTIEGNTKFKNNLKNILSPLGSVNDNLLINTGNININIDYSEKEKIIGSLESEGVDDQAGLKNGVFEEDLNGTMRKLDLAASYSNYFGFNIENGPLKIPTSIRGEFNLIDYKEVIDEPIRVHAMVRYKDEKVTHIEIIQYQLLNKEKKLSF